jgi:hypothetical protein
MRRRRSCLDGRSRSCLDGRSRCCLDGQFLRRHHLALLLLSEWNPEAGSGVIKVNYYNNVTVLSNRAAILKSALWAF